MDNSIYEFLGFGMKSIHLDPAKNDQIEEIRIGISGYGEKGLELTLYTFVEIDYRHSKKNRIEYISNFAFSSPELYADFKNNREESRSLYLSLFFACVFPFMRENVTSITSNMKCSIHLPVIDCRMIKPDQMIVLNPTNQ